MNYATTCAKCGAEIDSMDSVADTQAMLRAHMEINHSGETHSGNTLAIVHAALLRAGLTEQQCEDAVNQMQNAGILFRERSI